MKKNKDIFREEGELKMKERRKCIAILLTVVMFVFSLSQSILIYAKTNVIEDVESTNITDSVTTRECQKMLEKEEEKEEQKKADIILESSLNGIETLTEIQDYFVYRKGSFISDSGITEKIKNTNNIEKYYDSFEEIVEYLVQEFESKKDRIELGYYSAEIDYKKELESIINDSCKTIKVENCPQIICCYLQGEYDDSFGYYQYQVVLESQYQSDEVTKEQTTGYQYQENALLEESPNKIAKVYGDTSETEESEEPSITWDLDIESGILTISGSGSMENYADKSRVPWYNNRESVKKVIINNAVTGIGDYSFADCSNLNSVDIPESVINIGKNVFYGCSALEKVQLPNNIESIGFQAFASCTSLSEINIPLNWTECTPSDGNTIDVDHCGRIFLGCTLLKEITVPEGMVSIPSFGFNGCSSLEKIHLPNSLEEIKNHSFYGCKALTVLEIPDTVKGIIGKSAFCQCMSLEQIILPEGITELNSFVFYECIALKKVILANSIEKIGFKVFNGCNVLSEINIPLSWNECSPSDGSTLDTDHCGQIFRGCKALKEITVPEGMESIPSFGLNGSDYLETVHLPNTLTEIKNHTFYKCTKLKNIEIPKGVEEIIGKSAFYYCSSLEQVVLPEKVTQLQSYVFYGCTALNNIILSEKLEKIDSYTFYNCASLKKIDLKNVKQLGEYAFSKSGLSTILIENVSDFGLRAFENCKSLDEINFNVPSYKITFNTGGYSIFTGCGSGIGNIKVNIGLDVSYVDALFAGCSNLTDIIIPDNVKRIGVYAFYNCVNLKNVDIPKELTAIKEKAFVNCYVLNKIEVNSDITVAADAFRGAQINELILGENVTSLESAFYYQIPIGDFIVDEKNDFYVSDNGALYDKGKQILFCCPNKSNMTKFSIPKSITEISDSAFYNNKTLEEIVFLKDEGKATVASEISKELSIGKSAFRNCISLKEITMPDYLKSMGDYAMADCPSLEVVHFEGDAPKLTSNVFQNNYTVLGYYDGTTGWTEALKNEMAKNGVVLVNEDEEYDRVCILMLDRSWSMDGEPLLKIKAAVKTFCNSILANNNCKTSIGIIPFCGTSISYGLSSDKEEINNYVEKISCDNSTNIYDAFLASNRFLKIVNAKEKNIILMTDGIPVTGKESADGPYTSSDISEYYKYANAVYNLVEGLKANYNIFTIGFFSELNGNEQEFAKKFLEDLSTNGYYDVAEVDDLLKKFEEIADNIIKPGKEALYFTGLADSVTKKYVGNVFFPIAVTTSGNQEVPTELRAHYFINGTTDGWVDIKDGVFSIPFGIESNGTYTVTVKETKPAYPLENNRLTFTIVNNTTSYSEELNMDMKLKIGGTIANFFGVEGSAVSGLSMEYVKDGEKSSLFLTNHSDLNGATSSAVSSELGSFKSGISGLVGYSDSRSTTTTIDDFDINLEDEKQMGMIGYCLLRSMTGRIGNVSRSELASAYYNTYGVRAEDLETLEESATISKTVGQKDSLNLKLGDQYNFLEGIGGTTKYSTSVKKNLNSAETTFSSSIDTSGNNNVLSGKWLIGGLESSIYGRNLSNQTTQIAVKKDLLGKNEVSATGITKKYDEVAGTLTGWTRKSTVTFKDNAANALLNSNKRLQLLSDGKRPLLTQTDIADIYKKMYRSDAVAEYNDIMESNGKIEFEKNFGVISASVSGEKNYKFNTDQGVVRNGIYYPTVDCNTMFSDGSLTSGLGYSAPAMVALWIDGLNQFLGDIIECKVGNVKDGIKNKAAELWSGITNGWTGSVYSVCESSAQGSALSDDFIETKMMAKTMSVDGDANQGNEGLVVGNAYTVSVFEDEAQTIKLTEEQLKKADINLKISYTAEDLGKAGVDFNEISKIRMYHWNEEKETYELQKNGINNVSDQSVSAKITQPGEYILGIDDVAPSVIDLQVSDGTEKPIITAYISDFSGIEEGTLILDGEVLAQGETFLQYFNMEKGTFAYPVTNALAEGNHEVCLDVTDSSGNKTEVKKYNWDINLQVPSVNYMNISTTENSIHISVNVSWNNVDDVFLRIITSEGGILLRMDQEEVESQYRLDIDKNDFNQLFSVTPIVMGTNGKSVLGTTKTVVIDKENTIQESTTQQNESTTQQKKSIAKKVFRITLAGISNQIAPGKKIKLAANPIPADSPLPQLIWSSSNPKVATVTQTGVVTLKKNTGGKTVTITVTAADGSGISASWKIKSMKGVVKKIAVTGAKTVKAGKSLKLKAKVTATKGANKKLQWTSSNTKYATVTSSGKVKTFKAGKGKKVKITAMATDGSNKKKTVTIKIR